MLPPATNFLHLPPGIWRFRLKNTVTEAAPPAQTLLQVIRNSNKVRIQLTLNGLLA
jgi:hypothetical protein